MAKDNMEQPILIGDHMVPAVWKYLLPAEFFELNFPSEPRASCSKCPKVASESYNEIYRCCTYNPRVPNFMLGLALIQSKSASKIIKKMNDDGFLTPEGLIATPQRWTLYLADLEEDLYGRSERVRCQFLDKKNGLCGIYNYRNAVCSTFYCLHAAGDKGKQFWDEVQTLVSQCELSLGQWMMAKLDIAPDAYFEKLAGLAPNIENVAQDNRAWTKSVRRKLWGKWYGNELEYFKECGKLVLKHKEGLWDAANSTDIVESEVYDKATLAVVPSEYKGQIDDEDFESGDTISPKDLYKDLLKAHSKLYTLPGGPISLSDRVKIKDNPGLDPEERYYQLSKKIVEIYTGRGKKNLHERIFVQADTAKALILFEEKLNLDFELLQKIKKITKQDPALFVSQWLGQKVLRG